MQRFSYTKPATIDEAVKAVATGGASTRYLAGGTTLYDLMKLNIETPTHIVDITALDELTSFDTAGDKELTFGALAKMSDVAADERLNADYPALAESLFKAASQQLRNMATVGGNLLQRTRCAYFRGGVPYPCNKREPGSGCSAVEGLDRGNALFGGSADCVAVYPGDWAIALFAFDAEVDVIGSKGERTIAIDKFFVEPGTTPTRENVLEREELILRIRVPRAAAGRASTYHKIRDRESYAFALASAAVAVVLDGDVVSDAKIAIGGLATRPWRPLEAERSLIGKPLTEATAKAAGELALLGASAGHHNRFKTELGARTVADALLIAKQKA